MLKDGLLIGQYHQASSPIHNLDSRSKLIAAIIYMVCLFTANAAEDYILLTAVFIAAVFLSKIPWLSCGGG